MAFVTWPDWPVTVQVPATSANLGPGFDSLGLALGRYDRVQARVIAHGVDVQVSGVGADQAGRGEQHLVIVAMRAAFDAMGAQPPGISLYCRNEVPQGFGLGSSAAAIVAGVMAARALAVGGEVPGARALDEAALLRLACRLEGHPDNVAACISGGLSISWTAEAGVRVARLEPLPELMPVLCLPAEPMLTETARKALPTEVPHADAAANSARAALLIAALTTRPDLLLDGTEDYLHQRYRAAAMPATAALIADLRAAGIAAVVSGAGPAVLALTLSDSGPTPGDVARIADQSGVQWQLLRLSVDTEGARIVPG